MYILQQIKDRNGLRNWVPGSPHFGYKSYGTRREKINDSDNNRQKAVHIKQKIASLRHVKLIFT